MRHDILGAGCLEEGERMLVKKARAEVSRRYDSSLG
jgi:hypothetical protein